MTHVLQFALLGLGSGAVYALAAQGLVVAYRGSGVLNFSHGAVALLAAWVFTRTWADWGWPLWSSAVLGTATGVAVGGLIYCLVMRPLRKSAPLVRVIATLGVLACLQQLVIAVFGGDFKLVPKFISQRKLVVGAVSLSADRLILFGIAASVSLVLTVVFRYSRFGVSTRAVAESPVVASALGHSPHRISALNWMLSGGLAGVAGILIVQVSGLNIESTLLLVVPALAAALVAKFTSFSITFLAAVGIGIGQSLLVRYHNQPGWPDALPFVVIIVVLSLRGAAIPPRSEVAARLPKVGEGVLRPGLVAGMVAAGLFVLWTTPENWAAPLLSTCIVGIAALSLVVLTGYAGQISLGQYAFAGIGALVAGRLSQTLDLPFPLVFAAGTAAAALTGVLFALPSLRTRGVSLAVITLGLGLAVERVVLGNAHYVGGTAGTAVASPSILGFRVGFVQHRRSYATVAMLVFALLGIAVVRMRRGPIGRTLLAVRGNERAAQASGVSVQHTKVYAFGVSAAIAGIAGILSGFQRSTIQYGDFGILQSLYLVVYTLIGGVGLVQGAFIAALNSPGTMLQYLANGIPHVERYLVGFGGGLLILVLIVNPDGIAFTNVKELHRLTNGWLRRVLRPSGVAHAKDAVVDRLGHPAAALVATDITVRYGGVTAVDHLSLEVHPGTIVGLIGANGAGKTSFIDAVSGFAPTATGRLMIGDVPIDRCSSARRSRLGLGRSFQSMELFGDLTVRENILLATQEVRWWHWALAPFTSTSGAMPATAVELIRELDLERWLDHLPGTVPFGVRRLVGVARAAAGKPSVLLLDEPAAGLDDVEVEELAKAVRWLATQWGLSILLVEHHVGLVTSVSDEVVAIDFGRVIFRGSPIAVVDNAQVREAYLGHGAEAFI